MSAAMPEQRPASYTAIFQAYRDRNNIQDNGAGVDALFNQQVAEMQKQQSSYQDFSSNFDSSSSWSSDSAASGKSLKETAGEYWGGPSEQSSSPGSGGSSTSSKSSAGGSTVVLQRQQSSPISVVPKVKASGSSMKSAPPVLKAPNVASQDVSGAAGEAGPGDRRVATKSGTDQS